MQINAVEILRSFCTAQIRKFQPANQHLCFFESFQMRNGEPGNEYKVYTCGRFLVVIWQVSFVSKSNLADFMRGWVGSDIPPTHSKQPSLVSYLQSRKGKRTCELHKGALLLFTGLCGAVLVLSADCELNK